MVMKRLKHLRGKRAMQTVLWMGGLAISAYFALGRSIQYGVAHGKLDTLEGLIRNQLITEDQLD